MLHMNQQYDVLRSFLDERLEDSLRAQEIEQSLPPQMNLKQKLYWRSGEVLIALGEKLKCQVKQQTCGQFVMAGQN